jgi:hypothetical protein
MNGVDTSGSPQFWGKTGIFVKKSLKTGNLILVHACQYKK